jgi:hypothetical protein
MRHGLIVASFMLAATLIGIWLWQSGTMKQLWGISMQWWVIGLVVTFVLLRSTGVYAQFGLGLFILFMAKYFRTAIPLYITLVSISVYLYINVVTNSQIGDQILALLAPYVPAERLGSLQFRFDMEKVLSARAHGRFWFGWGGWDRSAANMDFYGNRAVQDSLWILAFGMTGVFGLFWMFTSMLLPVGMTSLLSYPARLWTHPRVAPVAVMMVVLSMYVIDCLMNATVNAVYVLAIGGLSSDPVKQPHRYPQETRPNLTPSNSLPNP